MPRKKTAAPTFTKAELFYIRQHIDTTKPQVIARDLDKPVAEVKKQIEQMQAQDRRAEPVVAKTEPAKPKARPKGKLGRFAVQNGTVSMTSQQSQADDEAPKGSNKEWLERHKNTIHIIK